ncbi:MAG: GNAT family N-acetyltransferase [Agathobacter sp.]|nr:GNAT family N-acetyltransferase [Agathobacter sp.]
MNIVIPKLEEVQACAKVYVNAYQTEPWNEEYEISEVEKYISSYLNSDTKVCFALQDGDVIKGVALGFIVPSISDPYLRLEDICIDSTEQRKGYGSAFMELLSIEATKLGCDSIILGTQKDFPSHNFYLKNGFREVESVLLYKDDIINER